MKITLHSEGSYILVHSSWENKLASFPDPLNPPFQEPPPIPAMSSLRSGTSFGVATFDALHSVGTQHTFRTQ